MALLRPAICVSLMCVALAACARPPSEVTPTLAEPTLYATAACPELRAARATNEVEVARWELPVRAAYRRDRVAVAFGVIGSLLGLRGDGPEHGLYAGALGKRAHIATLIAKKGC